jgi:uncharacterized membrane protein
MAKDLQDAVKSALGKTGRGAGMSLASKPLGSMRNHSDGAFSGARGVAAGAGAAVLAPLAAKGVSKLVSAGGSEGIGDAVKSPGKAASDLGSKVRSGLGEKISAGLGDKVSEKIDAAGGPSGILKDSLKGALGFGGGEKGSGGAPGTGKGRRMPVQQSVDIGAPLETVYNQWTQFEEWPNFMHRVTRVTQEDDCTVSFAVKIWGKTKEFTAEIETQRPDERVKWRVTQGMTHTGVVTFHELGPRLTRVLLGLDVEPGGLLEKAARGMRHVKRAARGDLHRFKAFVEMQEEASGGWRGVIEDGEVVESGDSRGGSRGSGSQRSSGRRGASSSGRSASRRSGSRASSSGGSGRGSGSAGSSRSSSRGRSRSTSGTRSRGESQ